MTENQFIEKHQATWRELDQSARALVKRKKASDKEEMALSFLRTYKDTGADLAYANTHFPGSKVSKDLNQLMGRCHNLLYEREGFSPKQFLVFLWRTFPTYVRKERRMIILSFLTFLLGAFTAILMVAFNEDMAQLFLDPQLIEGIKDGLMGQGDWSYPLMSAYIMSNNILVSLRAFVFGIFFGLGTVYVLFYNGLMLGALTFIVYQYGDPWRYWALILPHGVLELFAIFVAGGAGFMLARGILMPGPYLRRHAIVREAKKAMILIGGVCILLVLAGLIEGFITPLKMPLWWSYGVALSTGVGLIALFIRRKGLESSSNYYAGSSDN